MPNPSNLTRNQVAAISDNNPRAIKSLELIIQQVNLRELASLYFRKNSAVTLADSALAQSWLGLTKGVSVDAKAYEFRGMFQLSSTGTNSHTESLLFTLDTAVIGNIDASINRFALSTTATAPISAHLTAATGVTVTGAITTAQSVFYLINGSVTFSTGGHFRPDIQFSAAPGATSTVALGSWFTMREIGQTGYDSSNGIWS